MMNASQHLDRRAFDHELVDFFITIALAFRVHAGKAKKIKKAAEAVKSRLHFPEIKALADQFINYPEDTEFKLNTLTATYYKRQILKILPSK